VYWSLLWVKEEGRGQKGGEHEAHTDSRGFTVNVLCVWKWRGR